MYSRFSLNEHCFLVSGAKRGAIYDLCSGDIFSIDENALKLLEFCESGVSVQDIFKKPAFSQNKTEIISYLESLEKNSVGFFLKGIDKVKKIEIARPAHKVDFMWLEITDKCNLKCIHCYNGNFGNRSHLKENGNENRMRVIEDAYSLGCRKIQFIGGEPFLLGNKLIELVYFTRKIGYDFIEIFTNGMLIKEKQIDFLAKHNVSIAVSFYGPSPQIHNQVTLNDTSFDKTVSNLKKMKQAGLNIRVGITVMASNQDYAEETVSFLKKDLGINNIKYDLVRPVGKGNDKKLIPSKLTWQQKSGTHQFPSCSLEMFRIMKYGHNCFSNKICVKANGEVTPCIMEKDVIFGNAYRNKLKEILEIEKNKRIRSLNKDFIEVCKDCEYRYGCFDCRPKAKISSSGRGFCAKPADCLYDPHTAKWKDREGGDNL